MGKTIRTIIVLLAAVLLLAGCDPKMGDQGGFGTQGGEETQGGITINGITFPPREENIQFEENPSAETIELLKYFQDALLYLGEGTGNYITGEDTSDEKVGNWVSHMVVTHHHDPEAWRFFLKDGESVTVPSNPEDLPPVEIVVTKIDCSYAEMGEEDHLYCVGSFVKDGETHTFQDDYEHTKLDGASYHREISYYEEQSENEPM